jgi:hypothetical protein
MKQRYANNPEKQATLKWALQHRMAWRSPLTITCYDQSESERERLEQFDAFLQEIEQYAEEQSDTPQEAFSGMNASILPTPTTQRPVAQSVTEAIPMITPVLHRDLSDLAFWEDGT